MKIATTTPFLLLAGTLCVQLAWGQSDSTGSKNPFLNNTHSFAAGTAYQEFDAEFSATSAGLPPVSVDLDDLGIDNKDKTWMLGYRWRFAERWMLVANAYTFSNDGSREVERDFNYDGVEFTAGIGVDTSLDVDTYVMDVMYSVYHSDSAEIMLGGGLHAFNFEAQIKGRVSVGDMEGSRSTGSDTILAPLPNLRAHAYYAVNEKFGLGATAGWLSANYEDYDGDFLYGNVRGHYYFTPNFGLTLAYQLTDIKLTHERSSARENKYNIDFHGPSLQLTYGF